MSAAMEWYSQCSDILSIPVKDEKTKEYQTSSSGLLLPREDVVSSLEQATRDILKGPFNYLNECFPGHNVFVYSKSWNPYFLYTYSLKKVPFSGWASLYRPL